MSRWQRLPRWRTTDQAVTNTAPKPSNRLVRAATAELAEIERHREKLVASRESVAAELERLDQGLAELDARQSLLECLAPTATQQPAETPEPAQAAGRSAEMLRGPAIRETAVRVLIEHGGGRQALHYRDWLALITEAGYGVAGKKAEAVFLTQIGRSPAVRRSTQAGIYELDWEAPDRLRHEIERLQADLREVTSGPAATTDLVAVRARREQLMAEIGQRERALEEAERVLDRAQTRAGVHPSAAAAS
jgi:hypothetical protein